VLNDNSAKKFLNQIDWLKPLGQIFAVDRFISDQEMTLRVCFNNYHRLDFTLINADHFQHTTLNDACKVLYSKDPNGSKDLISIPAKSKFTAPNKKEVDELINKFWFMGVVAVGKIARKDYLVGSHLALEMAQNCIVLQMMIRDKKKGTNIHRVGESEETEIFSGLMREKSESLPNQIIELINDSAINFDKLAKEYSPEYVERYPIFKEWITVLRDAM